MNINTIQKIEQYVKEITKGISPVHGFCHLKRTAIGAKWFSEIFGQTEKEQNITYLAGLLHGVDRPSNEKVDHTKRSVKVAQRILEMFSVDKTTVEKVSKYIFEHRTFHAVPIEEQSVFLSDKLLEQSGAYIIFRRSYHIGNSED